LVTSGRLNPVARKSHSVEEVDLGGNVSIGFGLVYLARVLQARTLLSVQQEANGGRTRQICGLGY
jgi:hypothetical protein